ncbi:DNA/RNA non-specific endonuclease [Chitinophaga sp. Mgbs1]|uniref:DNA/RNA non-specific endonuclease n=1 Tax=Chitinophaga solisilvae TaxID=1233460 RepID=A0A433W8L8_9BACT|nr:DNA/RNA non-specific endonuclease [Chitinophaga solisilvae]
MPKKSKSNSSRKKSSKNNSLVVAVILIIATFAITTCSRKIAVDREKEPPKKTTHRKKKQRQDQPAAAKPLLQEDFEQGSKTNYNTEDIDFASGSWTLKDAVTGSLEQDRKAGKQSLRIKGNGTATMNFDIAVKGTVTVTLKYALYGADEEGEWELWASVNRGQRYTQVGKAVSVSGHHLRTATFTAATGGMLRFSLRKTDKAGSRINFDAFVVTPGGKPSPPAPAGDAVAGDDDNMLLGNPSNASASLAMSNNYLMDKGYYRLSYSRDKGTPNWVSWHIAATDLGNMSRSTEFRPDFDLPESWFQVTQSAYNGSGFDRGHNCPSGDRTATRNANEATFLMTNIIPQAPNHNQHLWAGLENYTRSLVKNGNEVYVIMGSYGTGGNGNKGAARKIGGNNVTVPGYIWKVIVVLPEGNNDLRRMSKYTRIIAVNTPNNNDVNTKWSAYLTSVEEIEKATGYRLLGNVPDEVRRELVKKIDNGG